MNSLNTPALTWHQSLEQWCSDSVGHSRQAVQQQADFAPFEAHKPEKFHEAAVVLVVLTSATRQLHRSFAEAAELIRAATSAFRAVLVTDLYQSTALEVCDWPVEQLLAEEMWSAQRRGNWLAEAAQHVGSAQQTYGASYIIAPTGAESAAAALRHLAYVYNAPTAVLAQALQIFAEAPVEGAAAPLGFRHGWETLTAGDSQRRTFRSAQGNEVDVLLHRGTGCGVVIDPAGRLPDELLHAAQHAGWSTAVLPAAGEAPAQNRFAANVERACADALNAGGPVLVCSSAGKLSDADADGRIELVGPEGHWSIELDSVAVIHFSMNQAPAVFSYLQSVTSTLLLR